MEIITWKSKMNKSIVGKHYKTEITQIILSKDEIEQVILKKLNGEVKWEICDQMGVIGCYIMYPIYRMLCYYTKSEIEKRLLEYFYMESGVFVWEDFHGLQGLTITNTLKTVQFDGSKNQ